MIIPGKIEILGIPYTVEEADVIDKNVPLWGQIDHEKLTICQDRIERLKAYNKRMKEISRLASDALTTI